MMKSYCAALLFLALALPAAPTIADPALPPPSQVGSKIAEQNDARTENERRAGEIMRQMLPPANVAAMESRVPRAGFAGEFPSLAYQHAYVSLWARPGLTPKERSLLTIGILIGGGHSRELRSHIASGLRNGLTRQQMEEIIYHSTAYAGFPAASEALAIAAEVVETSGK